MRLLSKRNPKTIRSSLVTAAMMCAAALPALELAAQPSFEISGTPAENDNSAESAAPTELNQKSFDSFSALRHEVLDFMSAAKERIWLSTGYLTDGEIVSALFIAKFRKIDVQILLGRQNANAYMSRLNYLKRQKIAVFLQPSDFSTKTSTAILRDNDLVFIDGDLNFLVKNQRFTLTPASADAKAAFENSYAIAAGKKTPANARPTPLVGRPGMFKHTAKGYDRSKLPQVKPSYNPNDKGYIYSNQKKEKPSEVPAALPKGTIWGDKLDNDE